MLQCLLVKQLMILCAFSYVNLLDFPDILNIKGLRKREEKAFCQGKVYYNKKLKNL
jgi:hypothetical protein